MLGAKNILLLVLLLAASFAIASPVPAKDDIDIEALRRELRGAPKVTIAPDDVARERLGASQPLRLIDAPSFAVVPPTGANEADKREAKSNALDKLEQNLRDEDDRRRNRILLEEFAR